MRFLQNDRKGKKEEESLNKDFRVLIVKYVHTCKYTPGVRWISNPPNSWETASTARVFPEPDGP